MPCICDVVRVWSTCLLCNVDLVSDKGSARLARLECRQQCTCSCAPVSCTAAATFHDCDPRKAEDASGLQHCDAAHLDSLCAQPWAEHIAQPTRPSMLCSCNLVLLLVCRLQVQQESHQETRNQQTVSNENFFQISVVSDKFEGMSQEERQRLVEQVELPLISSTVTAGLSAASSCMKLLLSLCLIQRQHLCKWWR